MHMNGAVTGAPRIWLRLEGFAVLAFALVLYSRAKFSWVLFGGMILVPDLALMGYLVSPRAGAAAYNALHSYMFPIMLAMVAIPYGWSAALALIWFAHIGMDRALGLGLKYPSAFRDTHLGAVGKPA
jgi:hypothetical protein